MRTLMAQSPEIPSVHPEPDHAPDAKLEAIEGVSQIREGSLSAPMPHPIAWRDDAYYDMPAILTEMERVFDICHGCRRCFNLCESFPLLFDLIDEGPTGELDGVDKGDYHKVVDACTLCDMCFLTKCPYVPPHPFDLDLPHPMRRHRASEHR